MIMIAAPIASTTLTMSEMNSSYVTQVLWHVDGHAGKHCRRWMPPIAAGSGIDVLTGLAPSYSSKRFRSASGPVGRTSLERCGLDTTTGSSCKARHSEDLREVAHANTHLWVLMDPERFGSAQSRGRLTIRRSTARRVHRQCLRHREESHASSAAASLMDRCVRAEPVP
jgi:hypothetical protein